MKKINLLTFLIVFLAVFSNAQTPNRCSYVPPRHADNWYFYSNAGIRFADAGVSLNNIPSTVNTLNLGNSCATFSDENGNLLIYTNGQKVYNKDHVDITGPQSLAGNLGSLQTAIIVQNPVAKQMLYVFTVDEISSGAKGLFYSRVDMTAEGGRGAVMDVNIPLLSTASSVIGGVKHGNGKDFWIVTHALNSNEFYSYKIDASGPNLTPITSSVGLVISSDILKSDFLGTLKISPKGDKLAMSSNGLDNIQLFNFDNNTGIVSNPVTIPVTVPSPKHGPSSIEFSPNGTKLYTACIDFTSYTGNQNKLYQYALDNSNNETCLNELPLFQDVISLQLGRDGKIYVLRRNKFFLSVIENPNRSALSCNYRENYLTLSEAKAFGGFPNFISSFFNVPPLDYDTKCYKDLTEFKMLNTSNVDYVDWNFGDTASGANNLFLMGPTNPTHIFSGPGNYTVTYTEYFNGGSWTDSMSIVINARPDSVFTDDTIPIINGSTIHIYAHPDMFSYYWSDGSTNVGTNIDYTITKEGTYTVLMENMACCTGSDTLTIIPLDIKIPTAFSPDGDGLNDYFRALADKDDVLDFTLTVFSKWGQMVWQGKGLDDHWDGKIGSSLAPAGIYTWYLTLNLPFNSMVKGKHKINGTLMLFR